MENKLNDTTQGQRDSALLSAAVAFAARAHAGQVDKGGEPYLLHPLRVMARCNSIEEKVVAVLHDVIEDSGDPISETTRLTLALREAIADGAPYPAGIDDPRLVRIMQALDALTRRKGETYKAFIERIALDPLATEVKLADLADNMDPARRPEAIRAQIEEMVRKRYAPAFQRLVEARLAHRKAG